MTREDVPIIDTHFHLWDLDANHYPWLMNAGHSAALGNYERLRRNYLVADLLKDIADLNVVAGVHIQAEHDHSDPVRETCWLQSVADDPASRGLPNAIIADADLAADNAEAVLEGHSAFANMRGIRHVLHRRLSGPNRYDPTQDPRWYRNFGLLKKYGLSFDMQVLPEQADGAIRLIRAHPDVPVILTHAAMPLSPAPGRMALWRQAMRRYAEHPNVAIKISGFVHNPDWTATSFAPIVSDIVEAFGPERCMLASNFPVDGLAKSYREIWDVFFTIFRAYSESEKQAMFWRNATRFYRIALPS